jgi:hypothetical protein
LSQCLNAPEMREHNAHMLAHRVNSLQHLRKARGIRPSRSTLVPSYPTLFLLIICRPVRAR